MSLCQGTRSLHYLSALFPESFVPLLNLAYSGVGGGEMKHPRVKLDRILVSYQQVSNNTTGKNYIWTLQPAFKNTMKTLMKDRLHCMTSVFFLLIGLSAEFRLDPLSIPFHSRVLFSDFLEAKPTKFRLGLSHAFFQQTRGLGAISHFLQSKDKAPSNSNQSSHCSSRFQS